jgi:hypothetical protein
MAPCMGTASLSYGRPCSPRCPSGLQLARNPLTCRGRLRTWFAALSFKSGAAMDSDPSRTSQASCRRSWPPPSMSIPRKWQPASKGGAPDPRPSTSSPPGRRATASKSSRIGIGIANSIVPNTESDQARFGNLNRVKIKGSWYKPQPVHETGRLQIFLIPR